jgi:hypothetical protein
LQVDCLATDFFHAPAYPTHLYYNPHATQRKVSVAVGDQPVDLYDAVTHRFLVRDIHGTAPLSLAGKTAAVTVRTPAGGHTRRDGPRLLVNDVVVDWNVPETAAKEAARVDGRSAP